MKDVIAWAGVIGIYATMAAFTLGIFALKVWLVVWVLRLCGVNI